MVSSNNGFAAGLRLLVGAFHFFALLLLGMASSARTRALTSRGNQPQGTIALGGKPNWPTPRHTQIGKFASRKPVSRLPLLFYGPRSRWRCRSANADLRDRAAVMGCLWVHPGLAPLPGIFRGTSNNVQQRLAGMGSPAGPGAVGKCGSYFSR